MNNEGVIAKQVCIRLKNQRVELNLNSLRPKCELMLDSHTLREMSNSKQNKFDQDFSDKTQGCNFLPYM